jgi:hypothetical protein
MAAGSAFLDGLGPSAPTGVRTVSIAARGDIVVPAPAAALAGAVNVVVPVDGPGAHADLPADPSVAREVALAVAGAPPTCEPLADVVADVLTTAAVHRMEVAVAAALPLST